MSGNQLLFFLFLSIILSSCANRNLTYMSDLEFNEKFQIELKSFVELEEQKEDANGNVVGQDSLTRFDKTKKKSKRLKKRNPKNQNTSRDAKQAPNAKKRSGNTPDKEKPNPQNRNPKAKSGNRPNRRNKPRKSSDRPGNSNKGDTKE